MPHDQIGAKVSVEAGTCRLEDAEASLDQKALEKHHSYCRFVSLNCCFSTSEAAGV